MQTAQTDPTTRPGKKSTLPAKQSRLPSGSLSIRQSWGISLAAVVLMAKTGAVGLVRLKKSRRIVIIGAFTLSAVLTPPDVLSQLLLALPLCLLYEAGLILASLASRPRKAPEAEAEAEAA